MSSFTLHVFFSYSIKKNLSFCEVESYNQVSLGAHLFACLSLNLVFPSEISLWVFILSQHYSDSKPDFYGGIINRQSVLIQKKTSTGFDTEN